MSDNAQKVLVALIAAVLVGYIAACDELRDQRDRLEAENERLLDQLFRPSLFY